MSEAYVDDASDVIAVFVQTMRKVFDPASSLPPLGGGTTDVRFFANDGIPTEVWDAHSSDDGCDEPFVWVRLTRRYRTREFPQPAVATDPCQLRRAIGVEIGVARCAVTEAEPAFDDLATEAEVSLDDSWRIERALCVAGAGVGERAYASDLVLPFGPEGGILGWLGTAYIELEK